MKVTSTIDTNRRECSRWKRPAWLVASLAALLLASGSFDAYAQATPPPVMHVHKVTLTAEQLLNLDTTPVELVPAAGPGRVLVVQSIILNFKPKTKDYFNGTEVTANVQWGSNPDLAGDVITYRNFQAFMRTAPQMRVLLANGSDGYGAGPEFTAQIVNQPVTISTLRPLTGGDGSVSVVTTYEVVRIQD
jgi:hypothetical protein